MKTTRTVKNNNNKSRSRVLFWGESKNGFVISDHMNFSLPKRSEKGSFTATTAWPRAPSDEENGGEITN